MLALGFQCIECGLIKHGPVVVMTQTALVTELAGAHEVVAPEGSREGLMAAELAIQSQAENIRMSHHQLPGRMSQPSPAHIAGQTLAHGLGKMAL